MRKSFLFLLLATVSVPAFAAPDDANDRAARREAARAERADARSERQAERAQPPQRSEPQAEARSLQPRAEDRPAVQVQQREMIQQRVLERRSERNSTDNTVRPALEQRVVEHRSNRNLGAEPSRPTIEQQRNAADRVREWRGRERRIGNSPAMIEQHNGTIRETLREPRQQRIGRDAIGNNRVPIVSRVPREGTQPPARVESRRSSLTAQHWRNNNWRSDHRYDWRNHRRHHRSLFQFGFYYDPFGWNYRHYSIGSRLWPSYYRSSYWLNDPWQYRLPYAPPGYRWIRYYDDALLVDTWDGQVVDVIYNFFW